MVSLRLVQLLCSMRPRLSLGAWVRGSSLTVDPVELQAPACTAVLLPLKQKEEAQTLPCSNPCSIAGMLLERVKGKVLSLT